MVTASQEKLISEMDAGFPGLTDQSEKNLVQVFKLLADETRLRILLFLLREGELCVSDLCERLPYQTQPAVSHHLALLRVAGLIGVRRAGKHNFYSVRRGYFHKLVEELCNTVSITDEPVAPTPEEDAEYQELVMAH